MLLYSYVFEQRNLKLHRDTVPQRITQQSNNARFIMKSYTEVIKLKSNRQPVEEQWIVWITSTRGTGQETGF